MEKIKLAHQYPDYGDIYIISVDGESWKIAKSFVNYKDYPSSAPSRTRKDLCSAMSFIVKKIAERFGFKVKYAREVYEEHAFMGRPERGGFFYELEFTEPKTGFSFQIDKLPICNVEIREQFFDFAEFIIKKFKDSIEDAKKQSNFFVKEIEI